MRRKIVKVVLIVMCFGITACAHYHRIELSQKRFYPKKPKFTIIPNGKFENVGIDFNAIYYKKYERLLNNKKHVTYNYYRFWSNGRVLYRSIGKDPYREEAEDFTEAVIGYYRVDGQYLIMEFFSFDYVALHWDYVRVHAILKKDIIRTTHSEIRGEIEGRPSSFIKRSFAELNRQPDW